MRNILKYFLIILTVFSCKEKVENQQNIEGFNQTDFTIAFGSCNRQTFENKLWQPILDNNPDVWIWGGDVIYSDTDNMDLMRDHYNQQMQQDGYKEFVDKIKIMGTWDDHDYGLNDGGEEFTAKKDSQQLFLDFIGVPENDDRRNREGVYHSETLSTEEGKIKIIVLDTRYFRTALTPSESPDRRYDPNSYGDGTILGEDQWKWLETELTTSEANFNVVMSSIQFLSQEHGFEAWGNMPHEIDRFKALIKSTKANNVILISGDRHISEFSKTNIEELPYPLIDFTSSGMTHSYESFDGEANQYRVGDVVSNLSFGLLKFNFDKGTVVMEMRGIDNVLQQVLTQSY